MNWSMGLVGMKCSYISKSVTALPHLSFNLQQVIVIVFVYNFAVKVFHIQYQSRNQGNQRIVPYVGSSISDNLFIVFVNTSEYSILSIS